MAYRFKSDHNAQARRWRAANLGKSRAASKRSYQKHLAANRERAIWHQRKRNYSITKEQYDAMFEEQEGCCKVCGKEFSELHPPCIDHDHAARKVRALLCLNCNALIGHAHEDIRILAQAMSYLLGLL